MAILFSPVALWTRQQLLRVWWDADVWAASFPANIGEVEHSVPDLGPDPNSCSDDRLSWSSLWLGILTEDRRATAPPVGPLQHFLGSFNPLLLQRPSGTSKPTAGIFSRLLGPAPRPAPTPQEAPPHANPAAGCYWILWSGCSRRLCGSEGGASSGGWVAALLFVFVRKRGQK